MVAVLAAAGFLAALIWWPVALAQTVEFVLYSLVDVSPLVIPGIVLAAWVSASGAGDRIAEAFNGRIFRTVFLASAIGAVTPVCGVTVLPLMAGLLMAGVPLAPVMAFWLSYPVTDPAMLATTAATLGVVFAIGKTLAAFGLGLLGGFATAFAAPRRWVTDPLRNNAIVRKCASDCGSDGYDLAVWASPARRSRFRREFIATARLVLICLIPAFAAEHMLNGLLKPEALSAYVGSEVWWAVPFAVFVDAPAYVDGYAALPLTRALIDHGMSQGAAMAFLVSGSVVSIWGALAIFPVLRLKPFMLYLVLAVSGSLISGWIFDLFV
ncbi:MAG: permease [Hyphomicrobiales bacterium]|nr:permease [Hyphomicrobiales bacterium]MCP5001392.1 permease [Hyphomicrobiales bacterium]